MFIYTVCVCLYISIYNFKHYTFRYTLYNVNSSLNLYRFLLITKIVDYSNELNRVFLFKENINLFIIADVPKDLLLIILEKNSLLVFKL